ncbi:hypothetical protein TNCV_1964771 [Trichonephila clavipes]|nr:hypothetical protein TNCV_1964771 [Trichonephila clavipes]
MAVKDRSITSRTVAHHFESITHFSVSARTIRRRLQQSSSSGQDVHCLVFPDAETQTSKQPTALKEGSGWQNGMKFTGQSSPHLVHNTTMVVFEFGDTLREDA